MKFLLVLSSLAVVAYGAVVSPAGEAAPAAAPNSRDILDSINKDLEEIKRTLEQSLQNRNAPAAGGAAPAPAADPVAPAAAADSLHFVDGTYLVAEAELKDKPYVDCSRPTDDDNIYKYSIKYLNSSLGTLDFSSLKGKPILLVNVATFCESTIEYPLLNGLKDKFGDKLEIVAFPSAQFENQEPTSDPVEIFNAIKYVRPGNGFVPKFPLTIRIDVNGENRDPIYSFLKRSCTSTRDRFNSNEALLYAKRNSRDIKWNFEKFLIDPRTGTPIRRYDQKFKSDLIAPHIEELLKLVEASQKQ